MARAKYVKPVRMFMAENGLTYTEFIEMIRAGGTKIGHRQLHLLIIGATASSKGHKGVHTVDSVIKSAQGGIDQAEKARDIASKQQTEMDTSTSDNDDGSMRWFAGDKIKVGVKNHGKNGALLLVVCPTE